MGELADIHDQVKALKSKLRQKERELKSMRHQMRNTKVPAATMPFTYPSTQSDENKSALLHRSTEA